jgi:hypothetical protein
VQVSICPNTKASEIQDGKVKILELALLVGEFFFFFWLFFSLSPFFFLLPWISLLFCKESENLKLLTELANILKNHLHPCDDNNDNDSDEIITVYIMI